MRATKDELHRLAAELLTPGKIQIFVVADKSINVRFADGQQITLEDDLKVLADKLNLPFRELALR